MSQNKGGLVFGGCGRMILGFFLGKKKMFVGGRYGSENSNGVWADSGDKKDRRERGAHEQIIHQTRRGAPGQGVCIF